MNRFVKSTLIFGTGLGIGAATGVIVTKKKTADEVKTEIEKMRQFYETREKAPRSPEKADSEKDGYSTTENENAPKTGSNGLIRPFSSDGGEESLSEKYGRLLKRVDYGSIETDLTKAEEVDIDISKVSGNDEDGEEKPFYDFPDEDEPRAPYIIPYEEFGEKVEKFGGHVFDSGLVCDYFVNDGLLVDDDTDEELDVTDYLGDAIDVLCSTEIGGRVYVRNEKIMKDYEIIIRGSRDELE